MPHLVTAIIKTFKLEEVKEALRGAGLLGLTVSEVQGFGRQGGKTEVFRGSEYKMEFVPKVKIEILVESSQAYKIVDLIATAARTGKIGDGKVWTHDLDQVMRIRTGELGEQAGCPGLRSSSFKGLKKGTKSSASPNFESPDCSWWRPPPIRRTAAT